MSCSWPPPPLSALAMALPWEHRQRGLPWEVARARWQMEAATASAMDSLPVVALLMECGGACDDWLRTVASWVLQTAPTAGWWVVGSKQEPWREQRIAAGLPVPQGCVARLGEAELSASGMDWATSARAGDVLHPSLAWTIALAARDGHEAVCWDWMTYAESRAGFHLQARHRAPWRDLVRELATDVRGRTFALPIAAWNGFPQSDAWQVRMREADSRACLHPEPLSMHREATASDTSVDVADALQAAMAYWGVEFSIAANGRLGPAAAAASVSVVLMYRDRPELTIEAIRSVLAQRFDGVLELVLVDNNSSESTLRMLDGELDRLDERVRVIGLSAPGAFNHSAQAALAANAATGEVLLWLNNDARLLDPDAIDQLARWARLPRVASVGVAMVNAAGSVVGGGMRARRLPGAEFNSPVEEASGADAAHARQTIGNTFACAAVSATAWHALGGLDAARFPAGYNDVEYCLRAVAQGWTHVNLGHVHVHHAVGASRAKQDEIQQKAWLRIRHPWTLVHALQEATCEPLDITAPALPRLESTESIECQEGNAPMTAQAGRA